MNNETPPALLIFYLMWNSSLLGLRGSREGGVGVARHTGAQSKERSQVLVLYMHGIGREG